MALMPTQDEDTMTTQHTPKNFDPAAYSELTWYYVGNSEEFADYVADNHEAWSDDAEVNAWVREQRGSIKCGHCGSRHKYGAVARHLPTGELVPFGNVCAGNLFLCTDRAEYERKRLGRMRDMAMNVERACADDPELWEALTKGKNDIIRDIHSRVRQWGNLSEKQAAFVKKLYAEEQERVEKVAEREAEIDPIEEGRRWIKGTIMSIKEKHTDFGTCLKMVVEEDSGQRVWGTVPSALDGDVEKGDRICLKATVKRSKDDHTFGFFSRPSNATKELV